jgi:hypothetical protein
MSEYDGDGKPFQPQVHYAPGCSARRTAARVCRLT